MGRRHGALDEAKQRELVEKIREIRRLAPIITAEYEEHKAAVAEERAASMELIEAVLNGFKKKVAWELVQQLVKKYAPPPTPASSPSPPPAPPQVLVMIKRRPKKVP